MTRKFFRSYAFVVVLLAFLQTMATMAMQFAALNFAVICVGKSYCSNNSSQGGLNESAKVNVSRSVHWDKSTTSNLLAAYPYGVVAGTIIASVIVDSVSVRTIFRIGSLTCLLSALVPVASQSWQAVFAIRFIQGAVGTGPAMAAASRIPVHWCDQDSRGTALGIILSGLSAGQLLMKALAGYLCCTTGWEWIFYLAAMFGMANLGLHLAFYREHPPSSCQESTKGKSDQQPPPRAKHQRRKPPLKMFISLGVLAIVINGYAEKTLQFYVQVFMPTYLSEALKVRTLQVGLLSALPELTQLFSRPLAGLIGDKVKFTRSATSNAKLYNTIACVGSVALLFAQTYLKQGQHVLAACCLCAQLVASSFFIAGYFKSIVVIAPRFTGMLMSMRTTVGFVSAVALPYVVDGFTSPDGALYKWNRVIYFVMAVAVVAALTFVAFGTMEVQPWAFQSTKKSDSAKEKAGKPADGSTELDDLVK